MKVWQSEHRVLVRTQTVTFPEGVTLDCGSRVAPLVVAYETYGTLSPQRDNAILVLHAFTGDAHAAFWHEGADKPGWWDEMIGPGKAFDTSRYFVICSNVLGGCKGTTGPSSIDPATGKPYGLDFPPVTIRDMVRVQKKLVEFLGIERLLAVAGGSMGGMQALQWAVDYPESVRAVICIAAALRHSAQQIALDEVGRQAIMADPNWCEGGYYGSEPPTRGLAVARMLGHITYMSDASMREKFGRRLREAGPRFHFDPLFEVEGYLRYRGESFIKRFDANSYLYITRAMDTFDIVGERRLAEVFTGTRARFLIIAFSSDWLYPPHQSEEIVRACKSAGRDTTYCAIQSAYGHDAFLVEFTQQSRLIACFLRRTSEEEGTVSPTRWSALEKREAPATHTTIVSWIKEGASVLDLGCGDGTLLQRLRAERGALGCGIEIDEEQVCRAVECGTSVIHGDIDSGLPDYGDRTFDYVILNQSLQQVRHVETVLHEALRVGRRVIVGFPNFAYLPARAQLFFRGRVPVTSSLPYAWYDTPNLHFLSCSDFIAYCRQRGIAIERAAYFAQNRPIRWRPNLRADTGLFLIHRHLSTETYENARKRP